MAMGHGFFMTVLKLKVFDSAKTFLYGLTLKFSALLYIRGNVSLSLPIHSSLSHLKFCKGS